MSTAAIVLSIILLVCSVALVLVILFQAGRDASMSGAITGNSSSNFYSKNKRATKEELMKRVTIIVSIIFMVVVFVLNIIEMAA